MTSSTKTAAQMVAEARQRIESLSPEQVATELQEAPPLLVDLREPDERAQNGSIPGAIPAPRGMLEFWADPSSPYHRPELEPTRRVILYCASGGRSALSADLLTSMGYTNVAHLDGGLKAWRERGYPIEGVCL
jgi:rhodanese-related sulfurtransferase